MKIKKVVYLDDSFVDFKGDRRPVCFCAVSYVPETVQDVFNYDSKVLVVGYSIGHINDINIWNTETGHKIALGRANINNPNSSIIRTNEPGFISSELVDTLLKKEMEYFKKDPGRYIRGYNDSEKHYNQSLKEPLEISTLEDKIKNIDVKSLAKKTRRKLLEILK